MVSNNIYSRGNITISEPLTVKKCLDFELTGGGINPEWKKAAWNHMTKIDSGGEEYESKFKILYSLKGIYVLFYGKDKRITTNYENDFDNLYKGDVFEAFFHPATEVPIYFEYEINQLNAELVLLIPNLNGKQYGWTPWHYDERRVIRKISVDAKGGEIKPGGNIKSWSVELFFPYVLFKPLSNVPPKSGTIWNANFCRLDYDSGKMIKWSWSPINVNFHEFEKFRQIKFE